MKHYFFLTCVILNTLFFETLNAQCAENIGFEQGTFSDWVCKIGTYGSIGGNTTPVISLNVTSAMPKQHTITSGPGTDSNTNGAVPVVAPDGGRYSVKIGDEVGQTNPSQPYATAVGVSYNINLVTPENAVLTYMYAVVVEENEGLVAHNAIESPKFEVIITDKSTNPATHLACGYYTVDANGHKDLIKGKKNGIAGTWWYSNWTKVAMDLRKYIGKTINLEFRVNDCIVLKDGNYVGGVHVAYAYVDMLCGSSGLIKTPAICANAKEISLCAPAGGTYKWEQLKKLTGVMGDSTTKNCLTLKTPAVGEIYKLTYKSSTGCDFILIDTLKELQVNTPRGVTLCAKQTPTYRLTAAVNSTDKVNYSWSSIPAGFTSTLQNPVITTPTQNTCYYVTVKDTNGCTVTDSINITATCDLTVTTKGATLCVGDCIMLFAGTTGGTPPYKYRWLPGNQQTAFITVCPLLRTVYTLTVTDSLGTKDSTTAIVNVNPLPNVNLIPFNVGIVTPASPSFDLTGGTPLGGIYSGKGVSAGKFYPASAGLGTHMITYSYTNNNGCKDSITQPIVVSELSGIKNVFHKDALSVYPNPYTQSFTIETAITKAEHIRIELLNLLGEVVSTIEDATVTGNYKKQVNTANLPPGIYFLSVKTTENLLAKKLIKN